MTFDLFADDPAPHTPPAPQLSPERQAFEAKRQEAAAQPCLRPRPAHGYRCRVGGGDACFSDDGGVSHFCMKHRPWGFLVSEREGFR